MTLNEIKQQLKNQYPVLRRGNEDDGYVEFSFEEYESTINAWAQNLYQDELKAQAEAEAEIKRLAAKAKLEALGLDEDDLKALGL